MTTVFGPIAPAPARDNFVFDFTAQIGASGMITGAVWSCLVSAMSPAPDDDSSSRIVQPPIYDNYQTSALVGDMLDGVVYQLQAVATIDDGRIFVRNNELLCNSNPAAAPPIVDPQTGAVQFNYPHWITKFPSLARSIPIWHKAIGMRPAYCFATIGPAPSKTRPRAARSSIC